MSDAKVTYELVGNVALVGLDRAGKRNALNDEMVKLLREAVFRGGEEARAGVISCLWRQFLRRSRPRRSADLDGSRTRRKSAACGAAAGTARST